MRRLLKKKADPLQQSDPQLPTAQKPPQPPPPLFSRFASSQSSPSLPSPRVISGPVPLAPRDSINRQSGPHDESPPKPSSIRVASAPMQRNRTYERQQLPGGGKADKPLPDPEKIPTQKVNFHTVQRGPVNPLESRTPPMNAGGEPPKPRKSIPEVRKRGDPSRNAERSLESLDTAPIHNKSGDWKTHTPISGSPERNTPSARLPPASDHQPSELLASQNTIDRPQPRRKYSPLEAFGLVSGENSPVPSTTASSVNLPSQNLSSVSTPSYEIDSPVP